MQIKDKIHHIRETQVILDSDLAELYEVPTKVLNQAVKRNKARFPSNFMFQLNQTEYDILRSQFVTSSWGGRRILPLAFTEQGVAMLSSTLKSKTAVRISIQIINEFIHLRHYLYQYSQLFTRMNVIENKQLAHDTKFKEILSALEIKKALPQKGIFYDGQVFDAYTFIADIIRSANKSITLIDNYIDDTVLTLLQKRKEGVKVTIFTKEISKQLKLDLEKFNSQNEPIAVQEFTKSHDRFIIIDQTTTYHLGASLKDAGKKWFAFSKFDSQGLELIKQLNIKE